jgi:type I restriction enzyme R subunit
VVEGGGFFLVAEALQVPDTSSGELVPTEYGAFVAGRIKKLAPSPADLAEQSSRQPSRGEIIDALSAAGGGSCRSDAAGQARSEAARSVLSALLDRYAAHGIDEVTSPEILQLPPIFELGSPRQIDSALADAGGLRSVVDRVQDWINFNESVAWRERLT